MSQPELAFFNSLSGTLEIEVSAPTEKIGNLDNERASPEARIESIRLTAEVWVDETNSFRELTDAERAATALHASEITLRGEAGENITHPAPDGNRFTVQQLLDAVVETERQTRGRTEWFGGVDVHHVFFEGIHKTGTVWEIHWGS